MSAGAGNQRIAGNQALTSDMGFTQTVVHAFAPVRFQPRH